LDVLARYIEPDTPVLTALSIFHDALIPNQKDQTHFPDWINLRTRLGVFANPESTVGEIDDVESIASLVRSLESNVAAH
jgi:hypothetical protein